MEYLFGIIALVIVFLLVRDYKIRKRKKEINTSVNENYDADEPDDEYIIEEKETIFTSEYPFFYALSNYPELKDLLKRIDSNLTKSLSLIKEYESQYAIKELMIHDAWRQRKGLPKYLQIIPIQKYTDLDIFVKPTNQNLPEVLDSIRHDELKVMCSKMNLKSTRSKKETINLLVINNININLDLFFKLNPKINTFYECFVEFALEIIKSSLDDTTVNILEVKNDLNCIDINEQVEIGDYEVKSTYDNIVVYYKNKKPVFGLKNFALSEGYNDNYVVLLSNGYLLLILTKRIGYYIFSNAIMVFDENIDEIAQFYVKGGCNNFKEISDLNFIYADTPNDDYWIMNYDTLKAKVIQNPENFDIYTLVNSENVRGYFQ